MSGSSQKSLVIVESPAKAKTIAKFLGSNYQVEASIGHIRDLPEGKKSIPAEFKSEPWAYLGVNVDDDFTPVYIIPSEKKKQVSHLKDALKKAKALYLATDEDREGEAISWHLHQVLKPKVPVHRLVFHEITHEAIQEALENTRQIDEGMVKAQETRRILDRLYGYDVSQLLWKKISYGLSAGRVQSVAVRLIVQRERERMAFHSATYFDLDAVFAKNDQVTFKASLVAVDGDRIPSGKDFDSATGKLKDDKFRWLNAEQAEALRAKLRNAQFRVANVEIKPFVERPKPPFTTSTLQQEANRKLGFTAKQTMRTAQNLYENGYITYMRTDSTTLAKVAIEAARQLVSSQYGKNFLHPTERQYQTKVKNAQEAHEAIRPAGHPFQLPEAIRNQLNHDEFRLFDLIWKRTIASQMADARKKSVIVTIEGDGATFQASGTSIEFEGFLRAYVEGSDDPEAELAGRERLLPSLEVNEALKVRSLDAISHTTQPPARFTEASLTQGLEERGIGRPSTYASIIETIQSREYVFKKGNALVPSWTAFAVIRLLEQHFGNLVDYKFTAEMEDHLDEISRNERENLKYLRGFYHGGPDADDDLPSGLKPLLESKVGEIDARQACSYPIGTPTTGDFREPIIVRVGKFGPFLEQGSRKASIPESMAPDEINLESAIDLLEKQAAGDKPLAIDPTTGMNIFVKVGRYGPYVQLGDPDYEDKRIASIPKGVEPQTVDLPMALKYLSVPRELGLHPEDGHKVWAKIGRFGPYIQKEKEFRSVPKTLDVYEITFEEALHLLAQPKTFRGRGQAKPPLKTFDESPVTGKPVTLLEGKYGPYLADGETNASLPKEMAPESITFEQALQLLAARALEGGGKKKKASKKKAASTKKKAAPKKKAAATKSSDDKPTATKKKAAKKTPVKKAATKKAAAKETETSEE
ncbi:MAG: type I DNA topoisomerase [Pirellulaceae bacterium]|nr:type I DNA topoisomerase [Pirellulaceae bacterium]